MKINSVRKSLLWLCGVSAVAFIVVASKATQAASPLTDAEVVALAAQHCTPCHSEMPNHPAFDKAPKGIKLETIEALRRNAKGIVDQAVVGRMMPLGNETDMTEEERERLGAWAEGQK